MPKPIKIVRIIARLNIGGPAIHAVLLTAGLNTEAIRSMLVAGTVGKSEGDMQYLAKLHGVRLQFIPGLGREIYWAYDLVALWKLYRILALERPDVVHTHTAKAGALGRIAALAAGVPVRIHTFHGHIFHGYFGRWKTMLFLSIERLLARITSRLIAISDSQLDELVNTYRIAKRSKFAVVPLGLDLAPFFKVAQNTELRLQGNSKAAVLGFVGRLIPIKNPFMALRLMEGLVRKERLSKGRLVIAGDGELRPLLEAQVRATGLESHVEFAGWQHNLADVYSKLDLIILTSLNEGTPVVLIEAMASGLPFVATNVGGVRDLMKGPGRVFYGANDRPLFSLYSNGALVEPDDEVGLVAAVEYLLENPILMQELASEGRKFVGQRFTRERLLKDIEDLYRTSLEKGFTKVESLA